MSTTFNLSDLDPQAHALVDQALKSSRDLGHEKMSVWMLMALMYQSDDPTEARSVSVALNSNGLDQALWIADIESKVSQMPRTTGVSPKLQVDEQVGDALINAATRARSEGRKITTRDMWIELLRLPAVSEQMASFGLKRENMRNVLRELGVTNVAELDPASFVVKYCRDLTSDALEGKLDPVIGRDEEIREAMNVLQRRSKNNPIFVGEPGVGKTAMVEGLAQRMVKNEVPESLKNKTLLSLDLGALIAGAKYKGELEERVKGLVKEIQERSDVVLFIDEIHTLVNSQGEAGGVGQLLKPALARGELRCIGATTPDEYRVHLEKDPALERRFERIQVLEPSNEDAIAILRGIKEKYALHHRVDITDQAIVSAVELSSRYMTDRNLPDKAIDLMDSAAARVRTVLDSKPEAMDRLDRRLLQLKVQRQTIKKEEEMTGELNPDTEKQLEKLEEMIEQTQSQSHEMSERWEEEKILHDKVVEIQQDISSRRIELQKAQRNEDLALISEIQFGKIPALENQLRDAKKELRNRPNLMMRDRVTSDQIAEVVSRRTGIPVNKMQGGEQERLANMEDLLNKQVIGQPEAVISVSDAVRRSRSGLSDPNKPIGSFLFSGSTGVGKTELCKVLSEFLFERKDAMVRIDMSEFMEKQSVARLIGAPPGYVGYEEGGVLTEAIRQHPYSVILFDEVEKAHPDVFNVLLQVLDEGHLTDGRGRKVDFKNTVIIMTSNLGAADIQELAAKQAPFEEIKESVMEHAKDFFRPEFLNRLDEIVVFSPLDREDIAKIAVLQTKSLQKRLAKRHIDLELSESAIAHLAEAGFDPQMGARPLKRAIQQELENPLAKEIVSGNIKEGERVFVVGVGGKLDWTVTDLEEDTSLEEKEDMSSDELSSDVSPVSSQVLAEKLKSSATAGKRAKKKEPAV